MQNWLVSVTAGELLLGKHVEPEKEQTATNLLCWFPALIFWYINIEGKHMFDHLNVISCVDVVVLWLCNCLLDTAFLNGVFCLFSNWRPLEILRIANHFKNQPIKLKETFFQIIYRKLCNLKVAYDGPSFSFRKLLELIPFPYCLKYSRFFMDWTLKERMTCRVHYSNNLKL